MWNPRCVLFLPNFSLPSHLTPTIPFPPYPFVTLCFLFILTRPFSLFNPLHPSSLPLVQGPQPEDGVPGGLYHAASGHRVPLHPLPRPPWRTSNSKSHFNHNVLTHTPHRLLSHWQTHTFYICILHLCFVFIPSLCFCCLMLLKTTVPRFLHKFTWNDVTAVLLCLSVCVGDVFPLPSFLPINLWISKCQSGIHPLSLACFHKITLFHYSPHTAPVCLLYSLWWVLSWDKIAQWFSRTHLCRHIFPEAVKCLKHEVACVCVNLHGL